MSAQESSVSMTHLDKKSAEDIADRLSIDSGIPDEDGVLPGDSHVRGSGMVNTIANLTYVLLRKGKRRRRKIPL